MKPRVMFSMGGAGWVTACAIHGVGTVFLASATMHCGGSEPPPKTPDQTESYDDEGSSLPPGASVGATFGGMNEEKVTREFHRAASELTNCWGRGKRELPYLSGSIDYYIRIDTAGKVVHAQVERSTLGDLATEKCMLDVLRGRTWPAPVGGEFGKARSGMSFDLPRDTAALPTWTADRVAEALQELAPKIEACKESGAGRFEATAYIGQTTMEATADEDADGGGPVEVGKILSVGLGSTGEEAIGAVECLAGVLREGIYPAPGSRPVKVSFPL